MNDVIRRPELSDAGPSLPGILILPSWLEERLGDPGLRIVDLREAEVYSESLIPGAVQLDLASLGTARNGCDNVLLPPEVFADLMEGLGIANGTTVVAYDDQWGLAASRLVWALHFYGHTAVAVLDGGWDRWTDEGRAVTQLAVEPVRATFLPAPNAGVGADMEWLSEHLAEGGPKLLDTRTQAEFDQGHLPGAIAWDWFNAVPPDSWNCTREPDDLRAEWETLGLNPSHEIVVYCRSGMRAAHTFVAMRHAGYASVRLYDGSWQEWSMRV